MEVQITFAEIIRVFSTSRKGAEKMKRRFTEQYEDMTY